MTPRHPLSRIIGLGIFTFLALITFTAPSFAQSASIQNADGKPVEVFADNGIEWEQATQTIKAHGNARAINGDTIIYADLLTAYYRGKESGGSEIWRIDADGNVKITSPGETAFGDNGVYDLDSAVMVLTGQKLKFVTPDDELTARDSLEYWTAKRMAVARGEALVIHTEKDRNGRPSNARRLKADVLTALIRDKAQGGGNEVQRVNAFGNVLAVTEQDVITADKGVYEVKTGIVGMSGSVKITRGENQLNGCSATVNLRTSVSKLFACDKNASASGARSSQDGRVRGLLVPKKE
ncbi:MAG: hypothetical protein OQJ99_09095 [Rhodospirillales bacterium]|nr:hypothetical protein [Rhodospirillales bacterium]MCW8862411.1 hypothetical protein [Rhodospirillales bacterium]MCW9001569.1 hypothetical protein [Rhodospirillales bacterium]